MGGLGKWMNTSLDLSTKSSNKEQKSRFAITDITNQDFRKLLRKLNNPPCLGYKTKQVHNDPNEAYSFPIKLISNLMKIESRVQSNFVKLVINKTIGQI